MSIQTKDIWSTILRTKEPFDHRNLIFDDSSICLYSKSIDQDIQKHIEDIINGYNLVQQNALNVILSRLIYRIAGYIQRFRWAELSDIEDSWRVFSTTFPACADWFKFKELKKDIKTEDKTFNKRRKFKPTLNFQLLAFIRDKAQMAIEHAKADPKDKAEAFLKSIDYLGCPDWGDEEAIIYLLDLRFYILSAFHRNFIF